MSDKLNFDHVHIKGNSHRPALLLLHGTGGDERDLLDLGAAVAPGATLLSPRGNVVENGQNRFFRRFAEGALDLDDLALQTDELTAFINRARSIYEMTQPLYAVGFSNGANMAVSLMFRHPSILQGAALLRPMLPFVPDPLPELGGKSVVILSGLMDPIIPIDQPRQLAQIFDNSGAVVDLKTKPTGHGLVRSDMLDTASWLEKLPLS